MKQPSSQLGSNSRALRFSDHMEGANGGGCRTPAPWGERLEGRRLPLQVGSCLNWVKVKNPA